MDWTEALANSTSWSAVYTSLAMSGWLIVGFTICVTVLLLMYNAARTDEARSSSFIPTSSMRFSSVKMWRESAAGSPPMRR